MASWGALPVDTVISNIAQSRFEDENETDFSSESNPAEIIVQQIFGIQILPNGSIDNPGQTLNTAPSQTVVIPWTLMNPGNGQDSYLLEITSNDLSQIEIFQDSNSNGSLDSSDLIYSNGSPPLVAAGEVIPILVSAIVPANQQPGRIHVDISGTSNGDPQKIDSNNIAAIDISLVVVIVVDDTDDGGAFTGNGSSNDPDDSTNIDKIISGAPVYFYNEVWNLGNTDDVINLTPDLGVSQNIPTNAEITFISIFGDLIPDTNGDTIPDTGILAPNERFEFVTMFFFPTDVDANSIILAVQGRSTVDSTVTDLTFNSIEEVSNVSTPDQIVISVTSATDLGQISPLKSEEIIVRELDGSGNIIRSEIFRTNDIGAILFDEQSDLFPLTSWIRDGFGYRLALTNELDGFTYSISPIFFKSDFDTLLNSGSEQRAGGTVSVSVNSDGSRLLEMPLDPAGFVFDATTNARIDGACATFYRCNDGQLCNDITEVDANDLFLYPNGVDQQENPQVTGPFRGPGVNVGTGPGAFQYIFANFVDMPIPTGNVGFYFVGIDFSCGSIPGANPTLDELYDPVPLDNTSIWDPFSGDLYEGQPFFVNASFPEASLLRIPLGVNNPQPLRVEKLVTPTNASIGDLLKFTITIRNTYMANAIAALNVIDQMPQSLRYREGSTKINRVKSRDPKISGDGRTLTWPITDLLPSQTTTITFHAIVVGGAKNGTNVNSALANGATGPNNSALVTSNTALARFKISAGVFTDQAYIFGKVYVDENNNLIQDRNEQGVKGVKIYTEFGRYIVTDSEGKYHFDNVKPGSHILKMDSTTIPANGVPILLTNRHFSDGRAMCVDVFPGDLFKANFAFVPEFPKETTESWQNPLNGAVRFNRHITEFRRDAGSGKPRVMHQIEISNTSESPLFDVTYTEYSPYNPLKGSCYLNGASYAEPVMGLNRFDWKIYLIEPGDTMQIQFLSEVPPDALSIRAELDLRLTPTGLVDSIRAMVPITLTTPVKDVFRLTAYFDHGASQPGKYLYEELHKLTMTMAHKNILRIHVRILDYESDSPDEAVKKHLTRDDKLYKERKALIKSIIRSALPNFSDIVFE